MRLVRSVNRIGRRTTSFLEPVIEDVVSVVVPNFFKRVFGKFQPGLMLQVRIDCDAHMSMFRQRQRLLKNQLAILVYRITVVIMAEE